VSRTPAFLKRDFQLSLPKFPRKAKTATASPRGGRHKQVVGLKIGASQVAAAVVANNGSPQLVTAVREQLPPDLVAGGEIRDPDALARRIDEFFGRHGLPRKNVRLGIGNGRIGVRVFERPPVDDERQLANAIRFRAYETLPIPIEEAMLDYHIIDDGDGAGRVLLAVAYRDLVDSFAATCATANVELLGVDLEAFALLRAVAGPPLASGERHQAAQVAVAIGHDRTTIAVSDGRVCEFTRVLEWGGANVTHAIERSLNLETEDAERIKQSLDLAEDAYADGGSEATQRRAAEAARREVQTLARELASSLHFYQGQPTALGFGEVAVTGGGSQLRGLAESLEEQIGVPVRVADPLARVGADHSMIGDGEQGSLAVAIGLGIED